MTSIATVVGCAETVQPVGTVARPHDDVPPTVDAAAGPDQPEGGSAQTGPIGDDPNEHTVGTVAHPPDHKK